MSYNIKSPTHDELNMWSLSKLINPRTNRKIKEFGPTYNILQIAYNKYKTNLTYINDNTNNKTNTTMSISKYFNNQYNEMRKNKIDPLLQIELPYDYYTDNNIFKFYHKWDPYTGIRNGIDENGPLCFDPDALIHYYYVNRLNHLWVQGDSQFQGYYDSGMGNGPDFFIKGRGNHNDWYLFRLPIYDCYLPDNHSQQFVTMGPILTDDEIKTIDSLAQSYNRNYYLKYNKRRPSLLRLKKIYDDAISKTPTLNIDPMFEQYLQNNDPEYINILRYKKNKLAVDILRRM